MSRDVTIRVDELHLYGVDPRDRYAVADAIEGELRRMVGEMGLPAHLAASSEAVRVGAAPPSGGAAPPRLSLGASVARAIHAGPTRDRGGSR